ncbi:MAG: SsrA-binding protein SmpB [Patescibacteria group bacterium]
MPVYTEHRKARFEYETLEKFEGGLALTGAEVKSIREGGAKLEGSYIKPLRNELWLIGAQIRAYSKDGNREGYDPARSRKVLVKKNELLTLLGKIQQKGLTLVPFSLYPSGRRIKVAFGLCRGRKAHDKREALKTRDLKRQIRLEE